MPTLNERAHELCDAMAADAERLGVNERTVRRILARAERRLAAANRG